MGCLIVAGPHATAHRAEISEADHFSTPELPPVCGTEGPETGLRTEAETEVGIKRCRNGIGVARSGIGGKLGSGMQSGAVCCHAHLLVCGARSMATTKWEAIN